MTSFAITAGICEDDDELRGVLRSALEREGFDGARDRVRHRGGARVRRRRRPTCSSSTSACPTPTGATSARRCAPAACATPVLFLTARDALPDRLSGFHAGGDDYLTKPFALAELLVRVHALLAPRGAPAPPRRPAGARRWTRPRTRSPHGDERVALTPTEFRLLAALAARPGEVVRRAALVAAALARRRDRPRQHARRLRRAHPPQAARRRRARGDRDGARRRATRCDELPQPAAADVARDARGRARRAARRRQRAARARASTPRRRACCARAPTRRSRRCGRAATASACRDVANDAAARPRARGCSTAARVDRAARGRVAGGSTGPRSRSGAPRRDGRAPTAPGDIRLRAVPVRAAVAPARRRGRRRALDRRRSSACSSEVLVGSLVVAALVLLAGGLAIRGALDGALRPVAQMTAERRGLGRARPRPPLRARRRRATS